MSISSVCTFLTNTAGWNVSLVARREVLSSGPMSRQVSSSLSLAARSRFRLLTRLSCSSLRRSAACAARRMSVGLVEPADSEIASFVIMMLDV